MQHNSIVELMLSEPTVSPHRLSSRSPSPAAHPSKRFKDFSKMSSNERPSLSRPPSNAPSLVYPPKESLARRRPAAPRHSSSLENPLNLKLPEVGLGRYHPINFSSQHSSIAGTPLGGANSPQMPLSPRTHQRQLSEAERRLQEYYRDRAFASGQGSLSVSGKPTGPKLEPAGSPGPVTPLELEGTASYFVVKGSKLSPTTKTPDKLNCQAQLRRSMSPRTPPIGSY